MQVPTLDETQGRAEQLQLPLPQPPLHPTDPVIIADLRDELDLIHPETLAATIGLAEQTLSAWRSDKIGPDFVKLGKSVFYRREDLMRWIAENAYDARLGVGGGNGGDRSARSVVVPLRSTESRQEARTPDHRLESDGE